MSFNPDIHEKIIIDGKERGYRMKGSGQDNSPPIRDITKGAFYGRFGFEMQVALETSTNPIVAVFKKQLDYRSHVNLDFPETISGLNYLVQSAEFPDFDQAAKAEMLKDGLPGEAWNGER